MTRKVKRRLRQKKNGQVMAKEKLKEIDLGRNPQKPRPISINSKLSKEEKVELIQLLKEFRDVFAWDYSEMPRLDLELVVHTLNVDREAKLVAQPARVFHTKIEKPKVKEMQKLLAASIIKPIQHPWWLSNIVPMKKKNGQIQCCIDFRNLNRVCLKDEFPSTARKAMFSFMDRFSGYNQIRMASKDAEKKNAFRTPFGKFFVMPF